MTTFGRCGTPISKGVLMPINKGFKPLPPMEFHCISLSFDNAKRNFIHENCLASIPLPHWDWWMLFFLSFLQILIDPCNLVVFIDTGFYFQ